MSLLVNVSAWVYVHSQNTFVLCYCLYISPGVAMQWRIGVIRQPLIRNTWRLDSLIFRHRIPYWLRVARHSRHSRMTTFHTKTSYLRPSLLRACFLRVNPRDHSSSSDALGCFTCPCSYTHAFVHYSLYLLFPTSPIRDNAIRISKVLPAFRFQSHMSSE